MSWKLIAPPTGHALSLAEAQLAARVDVDGNGVSPLDAEILAAIETYTSEAETLTKRSIIDQTWRLTLDRFPEAIKLYRPPLLQVIDLKFVDAEGVQQTLDPQDYFVDSASEPGYVLPAPGCRWPDTAVRANAVEVQIRCGYGADHNSVPASIRGFIRARIAEQFKTGKHAENEHVKGLLAREVVYG
jgi:uncharacterized phiE125 gp8 family phage protein